MLRNFPWFMLGPFLPTINALTFPLSDGDSVPRDAEREDWNWVTRISNMAPRSGDIIHAHIIKHKRGNPPNASQPQLLYNTEIAILLPFLLGSQRNRRPRMWAGDLMSRLSPDYNDNWTRCGWYMKNSSRLYSEWRLIFGIQLVLGIAVRPTYLSQ